MSWLLSHRLRWINTAQAAFATLGWTSKRALPSPPQRKPTMQYRSIAVHINNSARSMERTELAASIAKHFDAHLIGVAATGLPTIASQYGGAEMGFYYADLQRRQREHCVEATLRFDDLVARAAVGSFEHRISDDDDAYAMTCAARYVDLVVIGQDDVTDPTIGTRPNFAEEVVLHAGRPVVVVPYAGHFAAIGKNVMLAWDASAESARAATDAMPFLKAARIVHVMIVNGTASIDGHGEEPGADIAVFLARHGVKVEVVREHSDMNVANVLLSSACDFGTDLIVMGGYGHTRFREMLLGGVTRSIFEQMTVPVLMTH